ncbi:putative NAD dependent epimerase/dehydratase [Xylariaceae sp. FL1272]|nr:putative NAD dependent epimerase/dehydratase [Xylariaceae sp. FL1272]
MSPTIFVTGATGTLGKAVALELLKNEWKVKTTTRNPDSPAAKELVAAGAEVIKGDWDNEEVLSAALAGCSGMFMNLMPNFEDFSADARQGKAIVALAKAAGIKHAIFSSVIGADNPARFADFDPNTILAFMFNNKKTVEDATRDAGFEAYTIIRPGSFMSNWLAPKSAMWGDFVQTGVFTTAFRQGDFIGHIDEHDVGAFVVEAFKNPTKFNGVELELASELLTLEKTLEIVSKAAGWPITARYMSDEEVEAQRKQNPFIDGQVASRSVSAAVDMDKIKSFGVPLHTFESYLAKEKQAVAETYGSK